MLVRMQTSSGGEVTLNPTVIKAGSIGTSSSSKTMTQEIDLTKTYLVFISTNYTNTPNYQIVWLVDKGQKSILHQGDITQNITISGTTLSITNSSSTYSRSYCLTQLD